MQIDIHPEILARQRYSCNQCSKGCRSFLVGLRPAEAEAIEKLDDWRAKLGVSELFKQSPLVRRTKLSLAKRADGRCVFLGDDNLCEIHRRFGLRAKPFACQLYPFVLTPVAGVWRVGLRFDCPQVCRSEGAMLSEYYKGIDQLSRQLVGQDAGPAERMVPELLQGVKMSSEWFERINASLIKIVTSDALDLTTRLQWLRAFVEHLKKVKWRHVTEEMFSDLIKMFEGGLLAEVSQKSYERVQPAKRVRKLLGQIFFLLCQPARDEANDREGWMQRLGQRWVLAGQMKKVGQVSGKLEKLQPGWPDCEMADLEISWGAWPKEVEAMIERYLVCRIGGVNYCGANFYEYSMVEGAWSLLLAVVTLGWLMRLEAIKAGRDTLQVEDAQQAVLTIDGNLGYSRALGMGTSRLRLGYLSEHLEHLIEWYCH